MTLRFSVIDCLPGKIRLWNDLLCVEWDVKPCSTQLWSRWRHNEWCCHQTKFNF